jgi:hypothetical protein
VRVNNTWAVVPLLADCCYTFRRNLYLSYNRFATYSRYSPGVNFSGLNNRTRPVVIVNHLSAMALYSIVSVKADYL